MDNMKNDVSETIEFYNKNAREFVKGTVSVDYKETQDKFLNLLNKGDYILDFGCGSGRDTKYFAKQGMKVEGIDGSLELCKIASDYTGMKIKNMFFKDLNEENKYDGIWACSSILHLSKNELKLVFQKMSKALKNNGIIYTSFKYGDFEGVRNGRFFVDFTVEEFRKFIKDIEELQIEECWITNDVRKGRDGEKWLNIILRKI